MYVVSSRLHRGGVDLVAAEGSALAGYWWTPHPPIRTSPPPTYAASNSGGRVSAHVGAPSLISYVLNTAQLMFTLEGNGETHASLSWN